MAQLLYWLDRGDFAQTLHEAWIWTTLIGIAGIANIIGIAAILRRNS